MVLMCEVLYLTALHLRTPSCYLCWMTDSDMGSAFSNWSKQHRVVGPTPIQIQYTVPSPKNLMGWKNLCPCSHLRWCWCVGWSQIYHTLFYTHSKLKTSGQFQLHGQYYQFFWVCVLVSFPFNKHELVSKTSCALIFSRTKQFWAFLTICRKSSIIINPPTN